MSENCPKCGSAYKCTNRGRKFFACKTHMVPGDYVTQSQLCKALERLAAVKEENERLKKEEAD